MKVALVHELLTQRGGAESVLRVFADMFPDAPIYTLLYNEQKLGDWFPKERMRTAKLPAACRLLPAALRFNHHLYLKHFPKAVEAWDFSEFDLVLSSSSAFAHGIITNGKPKHLCYVHSPARYLWDRTHDVQQRASTGILGPLKKAYLRRMFHELREWDAEVAPRPEAYLAPSKEVQRRIELYWREESQVVHPPIDDRWFAEYDAPSATECPEYFLVVSTLTPYKRIDLAIEACKKAEKNLKIVGEGPDRKRLEAMADDYIEFYGFREGDELQDIYSLAKATIFPGDEDFGLVPIESLACGTPVIAYRSGGALETVTEGETGLFFDEPTAASLQEALLNFTHNEQNLYSIKSCKNKAKQFTRSQFEQQIGTAIDAH